MTIRNSGRQPDLIIEDERLVRGAGRYSDDLRLAGQLYGIFVRSVEAHARIRHVAVEAALASEGVVAIITAADMSAAGVGNIARPPPLAGRDKRPLVVPHRPALAGERVLHVGDPIALVVAGTQAQARDGADLVAVDYESLPAVTDAVAALAPGAPLLWSEAPGNLAIDWEPAAIAGRGVDVDSILASAPHVVRMHLVNQRIAGAPLETRGATAVFDSARDHYTLYSPSQSAHALKAQMCAILGVDASRLRVISGDVGGTFGLKTAAYPEQAALLVAAKKTGRPVHWMATRAEAFESDNQARDNVTEAALALDASGRFLALKADAVVNLGAFATAAGPNIATASFAACFPEMYDIPHVAVGVRLAFTNTVPTGPYRGAGRPESNYVMERLVDAAARRLAIDPIELRRRNLIAPAAMPYRSALGNVYDSGDFAGALAAAVARADLAGAADRRDEAARRGKLRGIGVSSFLEHAGGGDEGAMLEIVDGRVIARLGVHASGQGHATLFGDLVAKRLDVPAERVEVAQGDSDLPIRGRPAVGSRSTNAVGGALLVGADKLIETGRALAVEAFGMGEASSVAYRDGYFQVENTNHRLSLFDLAERLERMGRKNALTTVVQADAAMTYPNGCHIAEVEIDPDTGKVAVVRYVAVDDCGVVMNETLAEAQVAGGAAQGIGQALLEAIVYGDDGQLLTGTFLDYAMPRAADVPFFESAFHPVPSTTNRLGVKGVGEAGTTAAIAAVMNAIADAIPEGRGADIDMPATAEKVWRACRATG